MLDDFPSLEVAEALWSSGLEFRTCRLPFPWYQEYIFHTKGVASAACRIASQIPALDAEKAYIMGLLHDFGKRYSEKFEKVFHVRDGYEEMLRLGYPQIARICLTHSFYQTDFIDDDYASYLPEWRDWARRKLKDIVYDDYDRLIQFCDMLFEGLQMVTIETRIAAICRRYHLQPHQLTNLQNNALALKNYFSDQCHCDVYDLLGLNGVNNL